MQKLYVNEIFHSLQGEGARVGESSVFIRLAGCNLNCLFCDTNADNGKYLTISEIDEIISKYNCKWIVWTGGEPTLQLNNAIVSHYKFLGYKQAIETNGSNSLPIGIDYIALSPKNTRIHNSITKVHEVRIVFPDLLGLSETLLPIANDYYLSPRFDDLNANMNEINDCINYIKDNPKWKLSIQLHKLLKIQ